MEVTIKKNKMAIMGFGKDVVVVVSESSSTRFTIIYTTFYKNTFTKSIAKHYSILLQKVSQNIIAHFYIKVYKNESDRISQTN